VPQAIEQFLAALKVGQSVSTNTLLAYRADLRQFGRVVDQSQSPRRTAEDITPDAVQAYVDWLSGQPYKASTVARKMAAVRAYLRSGSGGETSDLLALLKPPPAGHSPSRVLDEDEVGRLLAGPGRRGRPRDLRDTAILAVLYFVGLRATEAVGLRMENLDLDSAELATNDRDVPLPLGEAFHPLRQYLEQGRSRLGAAPDERAVFLNQRGGALSRQGLWLVVKRWAKSAGLGTQISPHTLRLSRAAHMLDQGISKRTIQDFLGLSNAHGLRLPRPIRSPNGGPTA
jgi:integrase/recombinase XerD